MIWMHNVEGRKCFGTTNSSHFIYGYMASVKHHPESERGNPLPPLHGLIFPISSKLGVGGRYFICTAHTLAFGTPVVEHWLERESNPYIILNNLVKNKAFRNVCFFWSCKTVFLIDLHPIIVVNSFCLHGNRTQEHYNTTHAQGPHHLNIYIYMFC